MQVCLCFCLDLPSCFLIRWCQQNASAACHRLSPHPSSSSSSFRRPPFSRAGQGTPGTLPRVRRSAGSGWQRGEPRQAGCAWRRPDVQQGVQAGPLVWGWWPPSCHCSGVRFESEPGRPQRSGCYTASQGTWGSASWQGEPGGPFLSLVKVIF